MVEEAADGEYIDVHDFESEDDDDKGMADTEDDEDPTMEENNEVSVCCWEEITLSVVTAPPK